MVVLTISLLLNNKVKGKFTPRAASPVKKAHYS